MNQSFKVFANIITDFVLCYLKGWFFNSFIQCFNHFASKRLNFVIIAG